MDMSSSIEAALSAKRDKGFWIAGCTALLLSCVSYVNRPLVLFFNQHLFRAETPNWGWCLYVALRLPIAAFFVWTVLRFPVLAVQATQGSKPVRTERFFDPLMGLRALACFMVLMGHFFMVTFPFAGDVHRIVRIVLEAPPWCGVWIFFTLSGYLMGKGFAKGRYTLDETGTRLFLRNRLLRIGPILLLRNPAGELVPVHRHPAMETLVDADRDVYLRLSRGPSDQSDRRALVGEHGGPVLCSCTVADGGSVACAMPGGIGVRHRSVCAGPGWHGGSDMVQSPPRVRFLCVPTPQPRSVSCGHVHQPYATHPSFGCGAQAARAHSSCGRRLLLFSDQQHCA
jgi:hypothetical protein